MARGGWRVWRVTLDMNAFFLCGPTASGKTELAHRLALRDGYDILSADAMLVYRGMDIGTAKPTARERAEVRYFGLDLAPPDQCFSVADYLEAVSNQLQTVCHRPLLVTGGTGLYLNALIYGLDSGPAPDLDARRQWEELSDSGGTAALREALRRRAPARLAALPDPDNPRRLIRALEQAASGASEPSRSWRNQPPATPMAGLSITPEILRDRIAVRARAMVRAGLWSETETLLSAGKLGRTARQAIGYAEAQAYLSGALSEEAVIERMIIRTHRLAKRQMTWLRHQLPVEWISLDAPRPITDIMADINLVWKRHGSCRLRGIRV